MEKSKLNWIPRIILILQATLLSFFAFDAFDRNVSFTQKISAFIVHLIPTYIIIFLLIISWFKPVSGGIICILIGLIFGSLFNVWKIFIQPNPMNIFPLIIIVLPLLLSGILFIILGVQQNKTLKN
ncbi:MAG: hypothetical protein QXJ62_03090 [Nitrososphaeria archaeon]